MVTGLVKCNFAENISFSKIEIVSRFSDIFFKTQYSIHSLQSAIILYDSYSISDYEPLRIGPTNSEKKVPFSLKRETISNFEKLSISFCFVKNNSKFHYKTYQKSDHDRTVEIDGNIKVKYNF